MRYKNSQLLTAALSLFSVGVAMSAMISMTGGMISEKISALAIASVIAALSASMSILLSRRLETKREPKQIFLIYAREDLNFAREIAEALRAGGFSPWLDVEEIKPGQIWKATVARALEESAAALLLVSENLKKNGFVREELRLALRTLQETTDGISPLIPVRLEPDASVPEELRHVQWVNLYEDGGLRQLVEGLESISKHLPPNPATPDGPTPPLRGSAGR